MTNRENDTQKNLEHMLDTITRNSNYCIDTLIHDLESLQCCDDFVTQPKRKRKSTPIADVSAKKRKIIKNWSKSELVPAAEPNQVKQFFHDQAEGKPPDLK